MKNLVIFLSLFLFAGISVFAQVGINADNSAPDMSAGLDVKFNNKGFLLPRMTRAQRNAINGPAQGLMVFCINCGTNGSLSIFTNGSWITFSPCTVTSPLTSTHIMSQGQIIWNWLTVSGASGYKWNSTPNYETATDMGAALTKTETGTFCNITYNRYVWAYNGCGESGMTTLTATVPASPPATPAAGTHVATKTSIVWNWNTVSGAIGYKWNIANNYESAFEMGTEITKGETGLSCGVPYTRYVWAYNECGYSTPVVLMQTTQGCWVCGDPFIISHVAGAVAPVSKMIAYGSISSIPGEPAKCWITQNLGASQQATAVSDATEASAGWYWQFNRKQGYKHDGTTRTPNTLWINNINENSDWIAANDPCTLELGSVWRIPTYTEWTNVDNTGNWTNWNGPWDSGLKLHAGGLLGNTDGSLLNRGSYGYYWSSTQGLSATTGGDLSFNNGSCQMYEVGSKPAGFSLRCLKEN